LRVAGGRNRGRGGAWLATLLLARYFFCAASLEAEAAVAGACASRLDGVIDILSLRLLADAPVCLCEIQRFRSSPLGIRVWSLVFGVWGLGRTGVSD